MRQPECSSKLYPGFSVIAKNPGGFAGKGIAEADEIPFVGMCAFGNEEFPIGPEAAGSSVSPAWFAINCYASICRPASRGVPMAHAVFNLPCIMGEGRFSKMKRKSIFAKR